MFYTTSWPQSTVMPIPNFVVSLIPLRAAFQAYGLMSSPRLQLYFQFQSSSDAVSLHTCTCSCLKWIWNTFHVPISSAPFLTTIVPGLDDKTIIIKDNLEFVCKILLLINNQDKIGLMATHGRAQSNRYTRTVKAEIKIAVRTMFKVTNKSTTTCLIIFRSSKGIVIICTFLVVNSHHFKVFILSMIYFKYVPIS